MKRGTLMTMVIILAAFALCCVGVVTLGAVRWHASTAATREKLDAGRVVLSRGPFRSADLEGLPAPVRRYLRAVLPEGRPMIQAVQLRHLGTFNMSETGEQWKPFVSTQHVVLARPGFDWDGRIAMAPGLPVRVRDAYVAGEGMLHATLFGLISVAELRGTREMAEGELMRFLAESAWYPTVLLPGHGVTWEAVDDSRARATLRDGDIAVTLEFRFGEDALIASVRADARPRSVNGALIPTPWEGTWGRHERRQGILVPIEGEVAWLLPEGARPYWRGRLEALSYDPAS